MTRKEKPLLTAAAERWPLAWTEATVMERLRDALDTLSRLPTTGCFPQGHRSTMPEPIQNVRDWFPQPGEENFVQKWKEAKEHLAQQRHRTRIVPDADAITRMEEALSWQHYVNPRRLFQAVAARCLGESTGRTAERFHVSRETIRLWRARALRQIVRELNGRDRKGLANLAATR